MKKLIVVLLVMSVLINNGFAGCYWVDFVAANDDPCPTCAEDDSCGGTKISRQGYQKCAPVVPGNSGDTDCLSTLTDVGDWWTCKQDWDEWKMAACIAGAAACGAVCGSCIAAPTPINCTGCFACILAIIDNCAWCDVNTCIPDPADHHDIRKMKFTGWGPNKCDCSVP